MSGIEVRKMDGEFHVWDRLVEDSPQGTVFHSSEWLKICSESFNKNLNLYGCFKDDVLVGGCSLFIKRKGLFKIASSTCSMNPFGGIVFEQHDANDARVPFDHQQKMMNSLCRYFAKEGFDSIRITNPSAFSDIRAFTWNKWDCNVFYAYYLDLDRDIENKIPLSVKQDMGKAMKAGVNVRKVDNPKKFYDLYCRAFEEKNLKPPATEEFCNRVAEFLKNREHGEIWVSETASGDLIAGQILLRDNKRVYAWVGASNPSFKDEGYSYLLYSTILKDLQERGFKEVNLMSANVPRFSRFVTAFCPRLVPYYKVYKNNYRYQLASRLLGLKAICGSQHPCSLKAI